eukprot:2921639-Pleurochrysis_carterae.AAC.1
MWSVCPAVPYPTIRVLHPTQRSACYTCPRTPPLRLLSTVISTQTRAKNAVQIYARAKRGRIVSRRKAHRGRRPRLPLCRSERCRSRANGRRSLSARARGKSWSARARQIRARALTSKHNVWR